MIFSILYFTDCNILYFDLNLLRLDWLVINRWRTQLDDASISTSDQIGSRGWIHKAAKHETDIICTNSDIGFKGMMHKMDWMIGV